MLGSQNGPLRIKNRSYTIYIHAWDPWTMAYSSLSPLVHEMIIKFGKSEVWVFADSKFKGACSDPQPHPLNFFQTYGDFGTKS